MIFVGHLNLGFWMAAVFTMISIQQTAWVDRVDDLMIPSD